MIFKGESNNEYIFIIFKIKGYSGEYNILVKQLFGKSLEIYLKN